MTGEESRKITASEPESDQAALDEQATGSPDVVEVEVYDFGSGGYEVIATDGQRAVRPKTHFWLSFFLPGAAFILTGLAIMVWPPGSIRLMTTLLGVLVAFVGIMMAGAAIQARRIVRGWGIGMAFGIALVAVGSASILFAGFVSQFWIVAWAVVAVLGGAWDVAAAVMNDQHGRWIRLARGLVLALVGAAILISPAMKLGYVFLAIGIGASCMVVGVATIAVGLAARRAEL